MQLQYLDVLDPKDIETAFRAASKERAEAVLAAAELPLLNSQRTQVVDLAVKSRLPAIYDRREFVDDGGLMSYATNFADLARRAATYVDKILKGSKARRPSRGAADKVRADHQSESREADRPDDSAGVLARADQVIK